MTKILNPIVYFGTDKLSSKPLRRLLEAGFNVSTIITKPDTRSGRGHKLVAPEVKTIGHSYGVEILQPQNLLGIREHIKGLNDPLGILVSFGKIVPQDIIDLFPNGITNIHPSLLPKYRGPSPIETAILNGDSETGVSLMKLTAKMDAGPVFAQSSIALSGNETRDQLYDTLAELGTELLIDSLPDIASGTLKPTAQDDTQANYCYKFDRSMSELDVVKYTTDELLRQIRAFAGFPKSKLGFFGQDCIITIAHSGDTPTTELDRKCKDGRYLVIDRLIPPGKKEMTAQDFLNGRLR